MSIKFVKELPYARNQRGNAIPTAELDARPGQWAILREYNNNNSASPTATRLNLRLRAKGYEFAARRNGTGSVLYGRKIKSRSAGAP